MKYVICLRQIFRGLVPKTNGKPTAIKTSKKNNNKTTLICVGCRKWLRGVCYLLRLTRRTADSGLSPPTPYHNLVMLLAKDETSVLWPQNLATCECMKWQVMGTCVYMLSCGCQQNVQIRSKENTCIGKQGIVDRSVQMKNYNVQYTERINKMKERIVWKRKKCLF